MRKHRSLFLGATAAGLALRLLFFFYFPAVTDDSRSYADIARNWIRHGVYGQTQTVGQRTQVVATDTRLPGYPAFLAAIFWLFGADNFKAVLLTQILVDLLTCLIVADMARRTVSNRAASIAFVLAAPCPFLANYSAAALTETLEIFFTALALDLAVAALDQMRQTSASASVRGLWAATGAAIAACILLRPDGGILLAGVVVYLTILMTMNRADRRRRAASSVGGIALAAITVLVVGLAPLIPWAIRNFHTLHHFEPLAPRYANEPEELAPVGFNRWVKTWMAEYASVEEIYWNVQGDKIDPEKLPSRALDEPGRETSLMLIADYNRTPEQELTPQLDARFGELAAERIRAHPVRYYSVLPALRVADIWLRPRTDLLPPDIRWWEFNDDPKWSALAVGFGALNLLYIAGALSALLRKSPTIRYLGLMAGFVLLRSVFLATIENPEPRYTLECYPVVIVCAAACLARFRH